jgi:hypothetical protein
METFFDILCGRHSRSKNQSNSRKLVHITMSKKRKTARLAQENDSLSAHKMSSKLAIETWEDVADSEDEFLLNREKVLLDEGPEAKRQRRLKEQGMNLSPTDLRSLLINNRGASGRLRRRDSGIASILR